MKSKAKIFLQILTIFSKKNDIPGKIKNIITLILYITFVVILMNFSPILSKKDENIKNRLLERFITTKTNDKQITKYIFEYSEKYNLEYELLFAVIKSESGFNKNFIQKNNDSTYNVGLCAINTKKSKNIHTSDLFSPSTNIDKAAQILSQSLIKNNKNIVISLASYQKKNKNLISEKVGKSTLDFIQSVLNEKKVIENEILTFFEENSELL